MAFNPIDTPVIGEGIKQSWGEGVKLNFDDHEFRMSNLEGIKADLTLYLSPTGDDSTGDGLTQATPWLSIHKAIDYLKTRPQIDMSRVEILMWGGVYSYDKMVLIHEPMFSFLRIMKNPDASNTSAVEIKFDASTWFADWMASPDPVIDNTLGTCISVYMTEILLKNISIELDTPDASGDDLTSILRVSRGAITLENTNLTNIYSSALGLSNSYYDTVWGSTNTITAKTNAIEATGTSAAGSNGMTILNPYVNGTGTAVRLKLPSSSSYLTNPGGWTISSNWANVDEISYGTQDKAYVSISSADDDRKFVDDKIVVGSGIKKTILNPGASETLEIAVDTSGVATEYLNGAGSFSTPPDTTYGVFDNATNGLVPTPGSNTGFLKEDGTWADPPDTTYSVFDSSTDGLVPTPEANTGFLKEDGTWADPLPQLSSDSITSADSPYTLTTSIDTLFIDASGGNVTVNVPNGDRYVVDIKLVADPGANTVTLQMSSGDIDGAATYTGMTTIYDKARIKADGTNGWLF